jgi:hypothetical protein
MNCVQTPGRFLWFGNAGPETYSEHSSLAFNDFLAKQMLADVDDNWCCRGTFRAEISSFEHRKSDCFEAIDSLITRIEKWMLFIATADPEGIEWHHRYRKSLFDLLSAQHHLRGSESTT